MIELVIAAIISISSITAEETTVSADASASTTISAAAPGGTGNWDDNE